MATIASPLPRAGRGSFYLGMNLLLLGVVLAGFSRSYFLSPWFTPAGPALTPLFHVHGAIATAWFVAMIVQPALIARGQVRLHMKLGWFLTGLAVLMTVFGLLVGVAAMERGAVAAAIDPRKFFAIPFFAALMFGGTVAAAIAWRRHPETHKRLILLSSGAIIDAPIGRLFPPLDYGLAPLFAGPLLVILAGVLHDKSTRGRVHRAWIVGGTVVMLLHVARIAVMFVPAWVDFADWVIGLW